MLTALARDANRTPVRGAIDLLHPADRARVEERLQRVPVVGRTKAQFEYGGIRWDRRTCGHSDAAIVRRIVSNGGAGEFGVASKTGAIARGFRRRGVGEKAAVLALGCSRAADRPAVDTGRRHSHEEAAVEARVAGLDSVVATVVIEQHRHVSYNPGACSM